MSADARPALSVVLPAYNSARYVGASVDRLRRTFASLPGGLEVVVVDDGSSDGTADAVAEDTGVRVLRHAANRGKGAAVRTGMRSARGEVRAFTDADLPYGTDPMYLALRYVRDRGFHAVIGDRTLPGSSYADAGLLRAAVSQVASLTFRTLITGGIYDTQCGFKAFRGDVADGLFAVATIDGFAMDVELIYLLLKYRLDIKRVPVRLERNETSSVRVIRDSARAARDILRMRVRWARGGYRSAALERVLAEDVARDALPQGATGA